MKRRVPRPTNFHVPSPDDDLKSDSPSQSASSSRSASPFEFDDGKPAESKDRLRAHIEAQQSQNMKVWRRITAIKGVVNDIHHNITRDPAVKDPKRQNRQSIRNSQSSRRKTRSSPQSLRRRRDMPSADRHGRNSAPHTQRSPSVQPRIQRPRVYTTPHLLVTEHSLNRTSRTITSKTRYWSRSSLHHDNRDPRSKSPRGLSFSVSSLGCEEPRERASSLPSRKPQPKPQPLNEVAIIVPSSEGVDCALPQEFPSPFFAVPHPLPYTKRHERRGYRMSNGTLWWNRTQRTEIWKEYRVLHDTR